MKNTEPMGSRRFNIDYIIEDTKRSVKTHVDLGDAASTIHYQNQLIGLLDKDRNWLEGQNFALIAEHKQNLLTAFKGGESFATLERDRLRTENKLMKEALERIGENETSNPMYLARITLKRLSDGK